VSRERHQTATGTGPRPGGQELAVAHERQAEAAKAARAHLAALAADLATHEDNVARVHDQLAAEDPGNAPRYRRIADEARHAAHRAREFQRTATDGATRDP